MSGNVHVLYHSGMLETPSVQALLLLLLSHLDQLSIQTHHDNITSATTRVVDEIEFLGMDNGQHC